MDVASDFANKVNDVLQHPAGAIQRLNNILANALGMTVPSVVVTETTPGASPATNEVQHVAVNNVTGGNYTLTYTFLLKPLGTHVTGHNSGGSLATDTYYYKVTAVDRHGNEGPATPATAVRVTGVTDGTGSTAPLPPARPSVQATTRNRRLKGRLMGSPRRDPPWFGFTAAGA